MVCAAAVRPTSPSNLPQGRDSGPTNARKSALLDPFDQGRDLHPELPEGRMIVDRFSPRQGGQALVDLDAVLHRVPNAHRLARHGHLDRSLGVAQSAAELSWPNLFQPPMALAQRIALDVYLLVEDQPTVLIDLAYALGRRALLLAEQFVEHATALGRAGEKGDGVERFRIFGPGGDGQRQGKCSDAGPDHRPCAMSM